MAAPFLLDYPLRLRSPFGAEGLERLARSAGFGQTSQLVQLGAGEGGLHLSARLGCRVLVLDEEPSLLDPLSEQVAARGLSSKVELRQVPLSSIEPEQLALPEVSFDGVFSELRLPWNYQRVFGGLRRLLVPSGRLSLIYPVRISGTGSEGAQYWEKRLTTLPTPMALLEALTQSGFEALSGEVLSPSELSLFYEQSDSEEAEAAKKSLGQISWMCVLGRRREVGEKPPPSRRGDR